MGDGARGVTRFEGYSGLVWMEISRRQMIFRVRGIGTDVPTYINCHYPLRF